MAQTRYGFSTPKGGAGGILDIAPYVIDTFINEEKTGVMLHGVGVVAGSVAGANVKLPTAGATASNFEGVVVNNRTTEYDLEGNMHIKNKAAIGVMRYGRVYVRISEGITPAYGDAVYLIVSGDEAGRFINRAAKTSGDDADTFTTIAVKARFISGKDATADIAAIELFNQAQA